MSINKTLWVLVNTNNLKEAQKIGRAVLSKRLAACYGLIPKIKSTYFWPPRSARLKTSLAGLTSSHRLESNSGPTIVFDTLPSHYPKLSKLVKKFHSDKLPFIGKIKIEVEKEFYEWVKKETGN